MKKRIYFHECEHNGDLESYKDELWDCGAKVVESELNTELETCAITIEVEDGKWPEFIKKFAESDAYGFSSLSN